MWQCQGGGATLSGTRGTLTWIDHLAAPAEMPELESAFPQNGVDHLGRTVVGSNVALHVRSQSPTDVRTRSGVQ